MSVVALVVGQGHLARELVATVEAIAGPGCGLHYLDLPWECDPRELSRRIREAIEALDRSGAVLILTPLAGDAVFQQAAQYQPNAEVIGGVNLGMLLALACSDLRNQPLAKLVCELRDRGRRAIRSTEPENEGP